MLYIALIAVVGVLVLQGSGSIPQASVGGPLTIGLAFIAAALAVGVYEAWTQKRGVVGWIVNIVVAFLGAFLIAQIGGMLLVILLGPLMNGATSLAAAGGAPMALALAGMMLVTIFGSWGALQIVNRWR